jgi:hypothetical protein
MAAGPAFAVKEDKPKIGGQAAEKSGSQSSFSLECKYGK